EGAVTQDPLAGGSEDDGVGGYDGYTDGAGPGPAASIGQQIAPAILSHKSWSGSIGHDRVGQAGHTALGTRWVYGRHAHRVAIRIRRNAEQLCNRSGNPNRLAGDRGDSARNWRA